MFVFENNRLEENNVDLDCYNNSQSLILLSLTSHPIYDGIFPRVEIPHPNSNNSDRHYDEDRCETNQRKRYVEIYGVVRGQSNWFASLRFETIMN